MDVKSNKSEVIRLTQKKDIKKFIHFPYRHYADNKYWVAPLLMEQNKLIDSDKNPFFKNAEIALFMLMHNGSPAGRIAAIIDHRYNEYHNTLTGFFGFYECNNSQDKSDLLFKAAEEWLRERGMEQVLGPAKPGMMDEIGILVEGFDKFPTILMPYNKPYYDKLIKGSGYHPEMDLLSYLVTQDSVDRDRANRAVEIVKRRLPGIHIRKIRLKDIHEEVKIVQDIYSRAWKDNWGFIPLTNEEFAALADDLKMIVDDNFAHIAEIDGTPVGFSIAFPDLNQVLRKMNGRLLPFGIFTLLLNRKKINKIRTALMGVIPEYQGRGIDVLLHREAIENGLIVGVYSSEVGWIIENNVNMVRVAEKIGGTIDKRYRMYGKKLT